MLVLSRKVNEEIVLSGGIKMVVLGITKSNNVRIGIEAPPDVTIVRREILTKEELNAMKIK